MRYGLLAVTLLALNAGALQALTWVGVPLLIAKILVEVALIPVSFAVQRRWVFSQSEPGSAPAPAPVRQRLAANPAYAEHSL